jgi:hypothetical protein
MLRLTALGFAALLAGCATTSPFPEPVPERLPPDFPRPASPTPPRGDPATPMPGQAVKPPPTEREVRSMIARLLPANVKDRQGWAGDLYTAYASMGLPHAAPLYCASIAVIEQESSFQSDPQVAGLPAIVWKELEARGKRFGIPKLLIQAAMTKRSPDGRSYNQRIDSLKTEKQLNTLFEDMIAELPAGKQLFADYNPVRTGGPMQVSIAFAEQHVRERSYPYAPIRSVRDEVFTRRGGVYFGSAILLDYPAPYTDVVYRFADFNAGRYSSRNAAFQTAVTRLSNKALALDGDLLRYNKGQAVNEPSSVEIALRTLSGRLRMSDGEIRRDLLLEKSAGFGQSQLFTRTFALADSVAGQALPRQTMPQIDLKSPKITRQLTTDWFARRVEWRFRNCLARESSPLSGN